MEKIMKMKGCWWQARKSHVPGSAKSHSLVAGTYQLRYFNNLFSFIFLPPLFFFPILVCLAVICLHLPIAPYSFPSVVEGMMAMDLVDWDDDRVKIAETAAKEADQVVIIKTINVSSPS